MSVSFSLNMMQEQQLCAIVTVAIRISTSDFLVTIKSTINQLCLLDLAPGGGLINKNTTHHVLQNFYRAFQSERHILEDLFTMLSGRTAARKMPRTHRHTGEIIKRNLSWVYDTHRAVSLVNIETRYDKYLSEASV